MLSTPRPVRFAHRAPPRVLDGEACVGPRVEGMKERPARRRKPYHPSQPRPVLLAATPKRAPAELGDVEAAYETKDLGEKDRRASKALKTSGLLRRLNFAGISLAHGAASIPETPVAVGPRYIVELRKWPSCDLSQE